MISVNIIISFVFLSLCGHSFSSTTCSDVDCADRGVCTSLSGVCSCQKGFYTENCGKRFCVSKNGTAFYTRNLEVDECPEKPFSSKYILNKCKSLDNPCHVGECFEDSKGLQQRVCPNSFYTKTCSLFHDPNTWCKKLNCKTSEICVRDDGGYKCASFNNVEEEKCDRKTGVQDNKFCVAKVLSNGRFQHRSHFLISAEYRQKMYDSYCGSCANYQVCIKYDGLVPDTDFWIPLYRCIGTAPKTTTLTTTLVGTTTVTEIAVQRKKSFTSKILDVLNKNEVSIQRIDSQNYTLIAVTIVAAVVVIACLLAFLVYHKKYSFANILLKRNRSPFPYPHLSSRDHNRSVYNSSVGDYSSSHCTNDDGTIRSKSIHYTKPELASRNFTRGSKVLRTKEMSLKPPFDTLGSPDVMQPEADSILTTCDRYNSA